MAPPRFGYPMQCRTFPRTAMRGGPAGEICLPFLNLLDWTPCEGVATLRFCEIYLVAGVLEGKVSTMGKIGVLAVGLVLVAAAAAEAQQVRLTEDIARFRFQFEGRTHDVARSAAPDRALLSRLVPGRIVCPPACLTPLTLSPGVETVGELEVLDFMRDSVEMGGGLIIDARAPDAFEAGSIPGAVNLPVTIFTNAESNPFFGPVMQNLGGQPQQDGRWNLARALDLVVFCENSACASAPRAVEALLEIGYPARRLRFYRGGMEAWLSRGLPASRPSGS